MMDDLHAAPLPEERQVCRAIASLGQLAGIDVDLGEGPDDIDATLIQAAYECHFDDPEFLGGSGFLGAAANAAEVQALCARAQRVTRGLVGYLRRRAPVATLRHAQAQIDLVEDAFTSRSLSLRRGAAPA